MLHRRRVLGSGVAGAAWVGSGMPCARGESDPEPREGEDLISWIHRARGAWDADLYRRMLGAANAFKEGDAILGVAAESEEHRQRARELLAHTRVQDIDQRPPFRDGLLEWIDRWRDPSVSAEVSAMTLGELKEFLLEQPESEIHRLKGGMSSDTIACVTKLMSHEELVRVGAKVFNPLPGSRLGSKGYMGARIQPNSPTDHPEDIRWQVLNAFAFAVGDVLVGTNPVSSEAASVEAVQRTLRDVLTTFGIENVLPHCVLSHIDIQAQVETEHPGTTALWFQSIAGSDSANATFDVTLEKMIRHAEHRSGPYALYFETGQGADFTNGHGFGTDMVIHESRKYGFARGLMKVVSIARQRFGLEAQPWVHVNDVAGFIGPEVFRTREQLVRCCLEDIVMGKLHGLMIGLDVCTTLHMDVSLDDLGWCIDQIMPANPGYLMALPTRIDPMLGYLTTGYHDHVHVRERYGYRVDDAMWSFFQTLGVIDRDGRPTSHFGDPVWVYKSYCRRKGDTRGDDAIEKEARTQIDQVRSRGVFIAEGFGERPSQLPAPMAAHIHRIYEDAKKCIWAQLPGTFEDKFSSAVPIATQSSDREDYILHPSSGETLSESSLVRLEQLKAEHGDRFDTVLILSDGLNALALTTDEQCQELSRSLRRELELSGFRVAPEPLIVRSGRVRAGYRIGEVLFSGRSGRLQVVHVIGERPGSGHRTLSIYMTAADASQWSVPSTVDHNITKVVSGIATTALHPSQGAESAARILRSMR